MAEVPLLFDPTDPATALDPFPAYARSSSARSGVVRTHGGQPVNQKYSR